MLNKIGKMILCLVMVLELCACLSPEMPAESEPKILRLTALHTVKSYLEPVVEEFNADNEFGVTIELETNSMDNYKQNLAMAGAANEMADLFFTWEAGYLQPYVTNKNVLPLTQSLAEDGWQDTFVDGVFDQVRFDGEIYAIPLQQSIAVVFYNRTVLEQAGVHVPETWADFLTVCRTLQEQGIMPLSIGTSDWEAGQLLTAIMAGIGGTELYDSLNAPDSSTQAGLQVAAQTLEQLYDEGFVSRDNQAYGKLAEGSTAMLMNGDWMYNEFCQDANVSAFLLPAVNEAYSGIAVFSVDQCYCISSTCADPAAACAFLKLLTDRSHQDALERMTGQRCTTRDCSYGCRSELQKQISCLYHKMRGSVNWIDRGFSGEIGTAFNEMALAILNGRDSQQTMDQFWKTINP